MRFDRKTRTLTSWIAMLAILMAALMPSISHALGAQHGAGWVKVCTALGAKWVQADAGSTDPSPASGKGQPLAHCPCCSLHAPDMAVPAAPVVLALALGQSSLGPTAFLAAPHTLFAWTTAQPRAPPSRA